MIWIEWRQDPSCEEARRVWAYLEGGVHPLPWSTATLCATTAADPRLEFKTNLPQISGMSGDPGLATWVELGLNQIAPQHLNRGWPQEPVPLQVFRLGQPDVPRGEVTSVTTSRHGEVTSVAVQKLPVPPAAPRNGATTVAATERPDLLDELRERVTTVTQERPTGLKQRVTRVTIRAPAYQKKGVTTITACERLTSLDEWRRRVPTGTPRDLANQKQPEGEDLAGPQVQRINSTPAPKRPASHWP
jgi:hypothetical protein